MVILDFSKSEEHIYNQLETYDDIWVKDILNFLKSWWNDEDYFTSKTSGSTGKPKEIKIKKQFAINSAKATSQYFNFKEGQSALLCMNAQFIGARMMIVRAAINKMKLYCLEASKFPLEKLPSDLKIDFAPMLAIQVYNSLDDEKINNIRKILIGGSKISSGLRDRIYKSKVEFYSSYGMTETISHIALQKVEAGNTYHEALAGVNFSSDENSCLIINAPHISDSLIFTNDIVEIRENNKIRIFGRLDNVINSGGIKLYPEIIEDKLSEQIENEFFITSTKDEELGEKVILIIEGQENYSSDIDFSVLSKYEKPKSIYYLKEFIRNDNSKLIRTATTELALEKAQ